MFVFIHACLGKRAPNTDWENLYFLTGWRVISARRHMKTKTTMHHRPLWSVADWTWAETKPFKLVLKQEYSQEYRSKETITKTMFWKVSRQWFFITDNLNLWHGQALCARCRVRACKGLQKSGDDSWTYSYKHQTASFIVEDTETKEDVSGQESSWDLSWLCSFWIQKKVFKDLFTLCMEWLIGRWGSVLEHLECSGGVCRASGWGRATGGRARE